jgi:hypothetical protein
VELISLLFSSYIAFRTSKQALGCLRNESGLMNVRFLCVIILLGYLENICAVGWEKNGYNPAQKGTRCIESVVFFSKFGVRAEC